MDGSQPGAATILPERYAAVLVDVHNITWGLTTHQILNNKPGKYGPREIDWDYLIDRMLSTMETPNVHYEGALHAYAHERFDRETVLRSLRSGLLRHPTVEIAIGRKDVDPAIASDIWKLCSRFIGMQYRRGQAGQYGATLLLASGDVDFVRAIEDVRSEFGESLQLDVHVFGWEGSMAHELRSISEKIDYLDERVMRTGFIHA